MNGRIVESLAMVAIGDGVLSVLFPVEHTARWEMGPWAPMLEWFRDRPGLVRALGAAEVAGAVAVAAGLGKSSGSAGK
ncbi:hypothetical protein [Georgenia thermotolerans]|uniref:Uncharacterized protein n=1 Tax=Georgenia thermotolerans TaxID=527326 RepID=A0A7J5UNI7_9MICO|nr:hypothetical protein [Georgenia thermotolerans]KAE8763801.1 hypothetical protein GB883_12325 [Georgenia thermotolerans]